MEMTCKEAAAVVEGKIITNVQADAKIKRLVIDSREVVAGDFFIPLPGEHTDGHHFMKEAAEKGAVGCFMNRSAKVDVPEGMCVIQVEDTLQALQKLARAYRLRFNLPVVGVTGSVGKTTTKDLIAAILSARYNVLRTEGNLNNEIGLPLMLSSLSKEVEVAVLEMGMSGRGEIALLAYLAAPSIGVITNIGESHLEMLGSREGIAQAKAELLSALPADGTAIVNAEEALLKPYLKNLKCKVITFGCSPQAAIRCIEVGTKQGAKMVRIEQENYQPIIVEVPLPGRHNLYNLLAAVAVARELGLTNEEIKSGLKRVEISAMRLEMVQLPSGYNIINDAYNASPTSMAAALDVLAEKAGTSGKIAVLGDMLELGEMEVEGHRRIGKLAAKLNLKALLVMGIRAQMIAQAAEEAGLSKERIFSCKSHFAAAKIINRIAQPGDWILLKGSRGMRMEEVLTVLRRELE
ncbi:MAG: UDP-N-acetylmuramoyl-tripeptide--D-alanyl-D-alanine ligase [Firmicutes bacterium]|nr:UDP-N-acetylmuramoyl-tripeptide--D-alanyl-D-alanine ligase [Bacillota bacterium]